MPRLESPTLRLIACTLPMAEAELNEPAALAALLDTEIPRDWPPGEYDRDALLFFRDRLREGGEAAVGWYSWYALRKAPPPALIGACGYFGPPVFCDGHGAVEIGFSVLPGFRGQGLATHMARLLVRHAFAQAEVWCVRARTTADNLASQAVLRKAGLRMTAAKDANGLLCYELQR